MIGVDVLRRRGVPDLVPRREIARLVAAAAAAVGAPAEGTITVVLSDDAEVARLNATHMGKEEPTDVLSFPLLPPSAYPLHDSQDPGLRVEPVEGVPFALPPDERVHLGDIVVSVERAAAQATEGRGGQTGDVRWSAEDELRLLIVHGTLHLCGWDHAEPDEETAMRRLERRILRATGASAAR